MGNEKIHIIDQLFSQELSEAEAPVRDTVWEGIAAQMENGRLRKKIAFARFTAAASLLLLLGFGVWFFWNQQPSTQQFTSGNIISLPQDGSEGGLATSSVQPGNNAGLRFQNFSKHLLSGILPQIVEDESDSNKQSKKSRLDNFFVDQFGTPDIIKNKTALNTVPIKSVSQENIAEDLQTNTVFVEEKSDFIKVPAEVIFRPEEKTTASIPTPPVKDPEFQKLETIMAAKKEEKKKMELSPLVDEMFGNNGDQESSPESPSFNRFSIGGAFSPDYAFAATSPVQEANPASRSFNLRDPANADQANSEFVSAYSTGINFGYKVSERVGIQSGLTYSNRTSSTTSELDAFGKTDNYNSSFSVSFIELPLLVQYDLVSRENFSYYVSSGVSANLLWDYDNTLSNTDGQIAARVSSPDERKLQPSQANLLLRTGVKYQVLKHLSLNVEPGLRYGVLSNKYAFSDGKPFSLSLSTGASYNF